MMTFNDLDKSFEDPYNMMLITVPIFVDKIAKRFNSINQLNRYFKFKWATQAVLSSLSKYAF